MSSLNEQKFVRRTGLLVDKSVHGMADALHGVADGAVVMIGGFGLVGQPVELVEALLAYGARDLTIVSNNAGNGATGIAALLAAGRVRKVICSFPRQTDSFVFDGLYRAGQVELELVPQGNLAERIRAGGAGLGGFFTPTGAGTSLGAGKETREIDGRLHVFESPIRADVALVGAYRGDPWGNLIYRRTSRNFNPLMATAAALTIASVERIVALGDLDPESIVTPGIYVDRVIAVGDRQQVSP